MSMPLTLPWKVLVPGVAGGSASHDHWRRQVLFARVGVTGSQRHPPVPEQAVALRR